MGRRVWSIRTTFNVDDGAARTATKERKTNFDGKKIQKPSARVLWSQSEGIHTVSYHEMMGILKQEFMAQTKSQRAFERSDLVEAFTKKGKMDNKWMVMIQHFNALYEWFCGIVEVVKVLREEWNEQSPCAVAGFISRELAIKELHSRPPGTFIIRFSNSVLRSIVISYRDQNSVEHIKGELLSKSGRFLFSVKNNEQTQLEYSLAAFIQKYTRLSMLYDVMSHKMHSKAEVYFGRDHQQQQPQYQQPQYQPHAQYQQQPPPSQHHQHPQLQHQHQHQQQPQQHYKRQMMANAVANSNHSTQSSHSSSSAHLQHHHNNGYINHSSSSQGRIHPYSGSHPSSSYM